MSISAYQMEETLHKLKQLKAVQLQTEAESVRLQLNLIRTLYDRHQIWGKHTAHTQATPLHKDIADSLDKLCTQYERLLAVYDSGDLNATTEAGKTVNQL